MDRGSKEKTDIQKGVSIMSISPVRLLVNRYRTIGGISAIVMGIPGSGKTTLLLHLGSKIFNPVSYTHLTLPTTERV